MYLEGPNNKDFVVDFEVEVRAGEYLGLSQDSQGCNLRDLYSVVLLAVWFPAAVVGVIWGNIYFCWLDQDLQQDLSEFSFDVCTYTKF